MDTGYFVIWPHDPLATCSIVLQPISLCGVGVGQAGLLSFEASWGQGFCDHSCCHVPQLCVLPSCHGSRLPFLLKLETRVCVERSGEWEKKDTQARGYRGRLEQALGPGQFRKRTLDLWGKGQWGTV